MQKEIVEQLCKVQVSLQAAGRNADRFVERLEFTEGLLDDMPLVHGHGGRSLHSTVRRALVHASMAVDHLAKASEVVKEVGEEAKKKQEAINDAQSLIQRLRREWRLRQDGPLGSRNSMSRIVLGRKERELLEAHSEHLAHFWERDYTPGGEMVFHQLPIVWADCDSMVAFEGGDSAA